MYVCFEMGRQRLLLLDDCIQVKQNTQTRTLHSTLISRADCMYHPHGAQISHDYTNCFFLFCFVFSWRWRCVIDSPDLYIAGEEKKKSFYSGTRDAVLFMHISAIRLIKVPHIRFSIPPTFYSYRAMQMRITRALLFGYSRRALGE